MERSDSINGAKRLYSGGSGGGSPPDKFQVFYWAVVDSAMWEFLFCSDPIRAPLLTRGRNGSQRDVAYALPIHGQNVPELAGGSMLEDREL